MSERKMLLCALLSCFVGLAACGQIGSKSRVSEQSDAEPLPLKVEINTAKTVVKNNEDFSITTVVRNTGSKEQSLWVLPCCYSAQWTSDIPFVHAECHEACMHNFPGKAKLMPGQAYEKTVLVRIALAAGNGQSEPVTFRLGIKDANDSTAQKIPPIWSNAVTVSVTR